MSLDSLLGLTILTALEILKAPENEVLIVRTAPPFTPRGYTPLWGEERVARARQLDEKRVELLTVCELVGEERADFGTSKR